MHELRGKTLLLTGASMGIGRAVAVALAREGVNLVLNARSRNQLLQTRQMCAAADARAEYVAGDASKTSTVAAMLKKAESLGSLFGFIHAAGVLHPGPYLWELTKHDFTQVFQANVIAAFQLIRACAPLFLQQKKGLAVFFGSGAAEKTQPGIAAYCAAKAAEEHLARQLAAEAPQITALVYRPGVVETRMQAQARESQGGGAIQLRKVFTAWKDQDLLMTPEESAAGLLQLLSRDLRALHGRTWDARDL
ncbi:MAG TPA: SDR family oxidoreductase [Desulfonatronum sp.]|nr:SDR family oxidoreductase [Desulfonatronum sp.]